MIEDDKFRVLEAGSQRIPHGDPLIKCLRCETTFVYEAHAIRMAKGLLSGKMICPKCNAQLSDRYKEIERLKDALQSLYDEQNGPPLIRDQKSWQEAMDKACACLEESKP